MSNAQSNNPLDMLQGMWNQMGFQLPGMVTPTLDEGELEKQIRDLRSVENWLRMNLSMLQMTIQNLEMQKSALGTFRSMSESFTNPEAAAAGQPAENPFSAFFNVPPAATPAAAEPAPAPEAPAAASDDQAGLAKAAMWPWEMMSELNAKMQEQLAESTHKESTRKKPAGSATTAARKAATKKPAAKRGAAKGD